MVPDTDRLWQATVARDPRFDGWVFVGVKTSGLYCRPSCPARTPRREHVRFFTTAAASQAAGFRACQRCRPDASPGSPEWDRRADLAGRAMRLIADGVVDREGVDGLARHLGHSERHVHRELVAAVGTGPLTLARAQRAQTAHVLLETTAVSISELTFAAGFASVRQFNETVREVFATTPRALRQSARRPGRPGDGGVVELRLPYRLPLEASELFDFLVRRAVLGLEESREDGYRRSLRLPWGAGIVELRASAADDFVRARYWLEDLRDLAPAMQRSRALLDLDSDPAAVVEALGDDELLGPLVRASPGRRVLAHVDAAELAARAVLGQQVSLAGAATLTHRLVARWGEPLKHPIGTVTHVFPPPDVLAELDPGALGMPAVRARAVIGLSSALAKGDLVLNVGSEWGHARRQLLALPGIGEWTSEYIAMRALRDPDAFMASDLGVRHALERLGRDGSPRNALRLAERWRPYRAYALAHLWGGVGTTASVAARDGRARSRALPGARDLTASDQVASQRSPTMPSS